MKLFSLLALGAALIMAAANPQLHQVTRVYILAMGGGMDQFLANQLTKFHVFDVVTDPQKADAILTDHVGQAFESQLDTIYPPPKPPAEAKKKEDDSSTDDAKSKKDKLNDVDLSGAPHVSTFGRGKGNFFLVDRGSRSVLWSAYQRPKDSTPGEMEKTAGKVVKQLRDDLTDKTEKKAE